MIALRSDWKAPYFTLWSGQAISYLGSAIVQFALVWWLTLESNGSATVLAVASMMAFLPQIVLGPFAGVLVDRWNRRRIMLVADLLAGLVTLGLVSLFLVGAIEIWHVYAAMALRSVAGAFQFSALAASTSLMVPSNHLSRISGLNQALGGTIGIAAPPSGALLMSALPMQGVLMVEIVTMLFGVLPLLFIAVPQPKVPPVGAQPASFLAEFMAGLKYIRTWPGMTPLLVMICVTNFVMTPPAALLPVLVTKHFGGGAIQLAWLGSVAGFGVLAGGLALGAWGGFKRRISTALMGLTGIGIGTLVTGLAPATMFWIALAGWGFASVMSAFTNGPLMAVLQARSAPEMQGRLMSVVTSLAMLASPLSLAVAGPLADVIGVQAMFAIAGIGCAAIGLAGFFVPSLSRLDDDRTPLEVPGDVPAAR